MSREAYEIYINSLEWQSKRQEAIDRDGKKCRLCCSSKHLHVHHRYYPKVYGEEPLTDLITLCQECHNLFHNNRKVIQQQNQATKKPSTRIVKRREKRREAKVSPNAITKTAMKYLIDTGVLKKQSPYPSVMGIAMKIYQIQGTVPTKIPTRKESREIVLAFLLEHGIELQSK